MKPLKLWSFYALMFIVAISLQSCLIQNASPKDCVVKEVTITEIKEGSSYDIKLFDGNSDYYYINRGLQTGLTMEGVSEAILNKKVTLHVYKFKFGIESEHVSQLAVGDKIIFTEFN